MKLRRFLILGAILCMSTAAFAQDIDCETEFSLYKESFKQWAKNTPANPIMVASWRKVFLNCPSLRESTFSDGTRIMKEAFIKNAKDDATREKYIDTLVMVYETRIQYYPEKDGKSQVGSIKGRMGLDLMAYPSRMEQAYQALKESVDIDENSVTHSSYISQYFTCVINMVKAKKLDASEIIDEFDHLTTIVDERIKANSDETDKEAEKRLKAYTGTKGLLESSVQPYAKCEDLVNIYQKKFDAEPDNAELLKKIATVLQSRKCEKCDLYLAVAIKLHRLNPSPESAYFIGIRYVNDKKLSEATKYLQEATKSEDVKSAQTAYKTLAKIMLQEGKWEQGRAYARQAIELNRNDGEPYITIANLYAASAKECGGGDPMYSKAAFWAAVDKLNQAKKIDPSCAKDANDLIHYYSQFFPTIEDIFMRNYAEGQEYTVECWINEKTTIRSLKTE